MHKLIRMTTLGFVVGSWLIIGCGGSKPKKGITRDFSIPTDTESGYIYGKIVHNGLFGKKFRIVLKNQTTGNMGEIPIEYFSDSETFKNYFVDLEPGTWNPEKVITTEGKEISIRDLKKDGEHKEFLVDLAGITYVGTWEIGESEFIVVDDKEAQDSYMRKNYRYILTTNALVQLP